MTDVAACAVCEHADRTGSWVDAPGFQDMTHCRKCHGSWPRWTEYQHCTAGCCQTFTTASAAEAHRSATGACIDASAVTTRKGVPRLRVATAKGNARTTVTIWGWAVSHPHPKARP